jgi:tetratricopeptide (TPR) repeat protein
MRRITFALLILLVPTLPLSARDKDKEALNLLRLPSVKLEETTAPESERAGLKALTDDDPSTVAVAAKPFDVVYGFGGALVAPEALVVRLPNPLPKGAGAGKVELWASTVSPRAGFQLLRSTPLQAKGELQTFPFPPTAAKWVLVRFLQADNAAQIAIAEIEVRGHEGAPETHYEFNQSPAEAFKVLEQLKKLSALDAKITDDEAELFADVKEGRFQKKSFAEAALLASGVTDRAKRQTYLKQIDQLAEAAKKAIADAKTPQAKGEKLLKWLHAGPMAKGYETHQTNLEVVLDSGKFNCVSSATLYNILAIRLGLDLRAIEVPDHAFSILYDGTKHADIETTTDAGFNPERDPEAQKRFKEKTGLVYLADSHPDQRREVREAGLAAIIYYNRGVELTEQKRFHEALLMYFRAMSLDAEFASAVKNALAVLANWSGGLAQEKKFDEALMVLAVGVNLAPKDATLLHNRKVVWTEWADSETEADGALKILRRAAAEVPVELGYFRAQESWVFLRAGEARAKAGEWEKALAAVEPGLAKLEKEQRKEIQEWQAGVYLRWSEAERNAGRFDKAVAVLADARAKGQTDWRVENNLVYTVQEWARAEYGKGSAAEEKKAKEVVQSQVKKFADIKDMKELPKNYVYWVAENLRKANKPDEALAVIARHADLLPDKKELREQSLNQIYARAEGLYKEDKWKEALDVYVDALKDWPDDPDVKNNLVYTMQEGIRNINDKQGEPKAKEFLVYLKERFPKVAELKEITRGHVRHLTEKPTKDGKFEEALVVIEKYADVLGGKDEVARPSLPIYDDWARFHKDKGKWQEAVDVYQKGLKRFPGDKHLEQNAIATWDAWAATFINDKKWDEAIKIYEKGLAQFPKNGDLMQNLEYCKEMKKKG